MFIQDWKILLILLISLCGGCSLFGGKTATSASPAPMHLIFSASPNINLNIDNQPSPLCITVFQLQNSQLFLTASYENLTSKPTEALKDSLIDKFQYEIRPGQEQHFDQTLLPDAHFLGVIAGYRTIPDAKWRVVVPVKENSKKYCYQVFAQSQRVIVQPCSGGRCVKSK